MEFNPGNNVIKLCVQGMDMEGKESPEEASRLFLQAWNEATNDFEKYIAAYYVARHQDNVRDKLKWLKTALQFALKIINDAVVSAFPNLYSNIAKCHEDLGDADNAKKNFELANSFAGNPTDKGPFYHGTKADLQAGDLLTPGGSSNYQPELIMNHIYFTALANGAGLAAALAKGDERERVYIVEPTASFENDPNVTDKKFPGNPTRSYRSQASLKIVGYRPVSGKVSSGFLRVRQTLGSGRTCFAGLRKMRICRSVSSTKQPIRQLWTVSMLKKPQSAFLFV